MPKTETSLTELLAADAATVEEVRERAEKATKGPWILKHGGTIGWWQIEAEDGRLVLAQRPAWQGNAADSIANGILMHSSRTDVPDLCDIATRQRRALERVLAGHESMGVHAPQWCAGCSAGKACRNG